MKRLLCLVLSFLISGVLFGMAGAPTVAYAEGELTPEVLEGTWDGLIDEGDEGSLASLGWDFILNIDADGICTVQGRGFSKYKLIGGNRFSFRYYGVVVLGTYDPTSDTIRITAPEEDTQLVLYRRKTFYVRWLYFHEQNELIDLLEHASEDGMDPMQWFLILHNNGKGLLRLGSSFTQITWTGSTITHLGLDETVPYFWKGDHLLLEIDDDTIEFIPEEEMESLYGSVRSFYARWIYLSQQHELIDTLDHCSSEDEFDPYRWFISFSPNGKGYLRLGTSGRQDFTWTGSAITLQESDQTIPYTWKGDHLLLTIDGNLIEFIPYAEMKAFLAQ